jgi:hypothetical protein
MVEVESTYTPSLFDPSLEKYMGISGIPRYDHEHIFVIIILVLFEKPYMHVLYIYIAHDIPRYVQASRHSNIVAQWFALAAPAGGGRSAIAGMVMNLFL